MLGALFQVSRGAGSEESAGSLNDVVSLRDQARFMQVLSGAEPYDTIREAYLVGKAVKELGLTNSNGHVCNISVVVCENKTFIVCIIWNVPSLQLANNACKYVLAQPITALEDIFYATSVGDFFSATCKVSSNHACTKYKIA